MGSVATVWNLILAPSGPLNQLLRMVGISNPPGWLLDQNWALYSVIIVAIWKNFGYYMIILLAGLQGIPKYLYESAEIDGATKRQCFTNITVPMLSPTIFLCLVTIIIAAFQEFDLINILTKGGPGDALMSLSLTAYQQGFKFQKFGAALPYILILWLIINVVAKEIVKRQRSAQKQAAGLDE